MKTLHPIITTGIILVSLGIVLLVLRFYLDELAQRSAQSWYSINCNPSCLIAPLPDYWYFLQPLIYLGITICCIGIILISYKILDNRMRSLQK
ncbi:MAG: hypothetical protein ACREBJ_10535 [Nitrosotalea sp.]